MNWSMPFQSGCSQVLVSSKKFDSSICDWNIFLFLWGLSPLSYEVFLRRFQMRPMFPTPQSLQPVRPSAYNDRPVLPAGGLRARCDTVLHRVLNAKMNHWCVVVTRGHPRNNTTGVLRSHRALVHPARRSWVSCLPNPDSTVTIRWDSPRHKTDSCVLGWVKRR